MADRAALSCDPHIDRDWMEPEAGDRRRVMSSRVVRRAQQHNEGPVVIFPPALRQHAEAGSAHLRMRMHFDPAIAPSTAPLGARTSKAHLAGEFLE